MAQAVSSYWRNQKGVRHLVGRVELVNESGFTIRSTDLDSDNPITVTNASVSFDRTRNVWGSAACQILVPYGAGEEILNLLPASPGAPLTPIGGISFRLSAGFKFTALDDYTELVYCGRFDIDECEIVETAQGVLVDLTGIDLLGRLDADDIPFTFDIPWGQTIVSAAQLLVSDVIPWMQYDVDPNTQIAGRWAGAEGSNRLTNIAYMMAVLGFESYMNMDGTAMRMRRRPSTQDAAAWVYTFDEWGDVERLSSHMDRKRVFNGVVASGENPNTNEDPVRAVVWIEDINDPTHYIPGSPSTTIIGPRPHRITSPWILTYADAFNAATAELQRIRGLLQRVELQIAVNPAINVGDVIDVTRPDIGVVGRYLVQSLAFNLDSSRMTLSCEERLVSDDFP